MQTVGAVYQVDLRKGAVKMILKGTEKFKKTGWAVKAISTTLLAVSSPGTATQHKTHTLTGEVVILKKDQNGAFSEMVKFSG